MQQTFLYIFANAMPNSVHVRGFITQSDQHLCDGGLKTEGLKHSGFSCEWRPPMESKNETSSHTCQDMCKALEVVFQGKSPTLLLGGTSMARQRFRGHGFLRKAKTRLAKEKIASVIFHRSLKCALGVALLNNLVVKQPPIVTSRGWDRARESRFCFPSGAAISRVKTLYMRVQSNFLDGWLIGRVVDYLALALAAWLARLIGRAVWLAGCLVGWLIVCVGWAALDWIGLG